MRSMALGRSRILTPDEATTSGPDTTTQSPDLRPVSLATEGNSQAPAAEAAFVRPIIEIDHVSMTFQVNDKQLTVFNDFTYKIPPRSFLSVIGPSGCGKSTLLRLISGLDRPTSGYVIFNGREIDGPPKGMIYVFQQYTKS